MYVLSSRRPAQGGAGRGWPRAQWMRWHRILSRPRGRAQMGVQPSSVDGTGRDPLSTAFPDVPATLSAAPWSTTTSSSPAARSGTSYQCWWKEWHAPAWWNAERGAPERRPTRSPSSLHPRWYRSLTIGGWTTLRSPGDQPARGRTAPHSRRRTRPGTAAGRVKMPTAVPDRGTHRTCRAVAGDVSRPRRWAAAQRRSGVSAGLHREGRAPT